MYSGLVGDKCVSVEIGKSFKGSKETTAERFVLRTLLVVYSYHHKNTLKVAEVFAKIFEAEISEPQQTRPKQALVSTIWCGFGAGIDSGKHYKQLLDFADQLPSADGKKAFIFSTSGVSNPKYKTKIHTALREKLQTKGYIILDEFNCHGFNTNVFLKYIGGMNKGHPNTEDLKEAEEFAEKIKQTLSSEV